MQYFIYENWAADGHKARIHLSTCRFCNYGKGIHPNSSNKNGRWHGPFESLPEARDNAYKIGRNVSLCKKCNP